MDDKKIQKVIQNNQCAFDNIEIEFPVSFTLKAVMNATFTDEVNKENLEKVFILLNIENSFIEAKKSSKGTYISYHYNVKLINKKQMDDMYSELRKVEGLKFAL